MSAPWLFAEAYKVSFRSLCSTFEYLPYCDIRLQYRREFASFVSSQITSKCQLTGLHECFSVSKYWKDYDVFFRQKCETFSRSSQAVFELSTRFATPFHQPQGASAEELLKAKQLLFKELTQVCLWGNSTDLSLLIDMNEDDIKKLQSTGGEHLAATEKNILGNDLNRVWEIVSSWPNGGRVDFVLDNGGFELFTDLVYADWLLQSGLCTQIRFHGKRIPWFVVSLNSSTALMMPELMFEPERCHPQGLELVAQHCRLWPSLRSSFRRRACKFETYGKAMEGI